jgi:DNA modification methylase
MAGESSYEGTRTRILGLVEDSYRSLSNHGHLAILLDPIVHADRQSSWELAADIVLFAEKHDLVALPSAYFQHKRVAKETLAYIPGIDVEAAKFNLANEGFTYRDCFVLAPNEDSRMSEVSLLLVLQKNQRDETPIPCPACRSHEVQGNSYPSLGVRSWECCNLLCPDRSKYNRGKRYSFRALLMQEAIDDERNEIPEEMVRSWVRDVQFRRTKDDVFAMLARHYSLHGDTIHVFGSARTSGELVGRSVVSHRIPQIDSSRSGNSEKFFNGPFFERYIVSRDPPALGERREEKRSDVRDAGSMRVIKGDCFAVMSSLEAASFHGAVTSPPYFNARAYAQWDNIYCYLHDMYNAARQVFKLLEPGSLYFYNIFDYFDNEKSVAFSAMGQKRVILSAYAVDLFRRAGFECAGNVVWDKGAIEGKRGFNAGNFSPYYQAPFNCWEHILVFRKPGARAGASVLGIAAVLQAKPVMKMVRGENIHGHTAPYPEAIPELLAPFVQKGGVVIDPYGGSGTTGRALGRQGIRSVCIERQEDYCQLAIEMYKSEIVAEPPRASATLGRATKRQLNNKLQLGLFGAPEK